MKIDVGTELKDMDGNAIPLDLSAQQAVMAIAQVMDFVPNDRREEARAALDEIIKKTTLRRIVAYLIGTGVKDMGPDKLGELYMIGMRFPREGEVELSTKEASLLQEAIGKVFVMPAIVGQCKQLLDGK